MALEKKRLSEIPQDAVVLTEQQALVYESRILSTWPYVSDTYGFRYGRVVLATASLFSGIYANNFFRIKFRLLNYGRLSSYLPICVIPAGLSLLVHQNFILSDLVLRKDKCPVCLQSRAAALQAVTGCLLPFIVAPVMSLSLVHRFHTFDMPYISKEPLKALGIVGRQFMKMKNVGFGIFLGQALLGSLVTYFESNSLFKVNMKLLEAEKSAEFAS